MDALAVVDVQDVQTHVEDPVLDVHLVLQDANHLV